MRRFTYFGDINAEHGGYFYCLDTWKDGYVDVVRIIPCSDAGGPDNCFWVETLTVLIPEPGSEKEKQALACCGWVQEIDKVQGVKRKRMLLDAALSYGLYDPCHVKLTHNWTEIVQVGKVQDDYSEREGPFKPNVVLRSNARIFNYARQRTKEM